jgi:hypothetical protein
MPNFLISLVEQAERLGDDLFELAVISLENPQRRDFNKICNVLEEALQRQERRKRLAGLLPI